LAKSVDAHTHFVPSAIPAAPGRNARWPSIKRTQGDEAAVIIGGKFFRGIDSRSWSADRRLEDMDEDGIDVQVVSPMPELLSHWFPANDADVLADHVNHGITELCALRPERFVGIGMVPMQDPALAARRLTTVKSLGLVGIEIGTHIDGIPLGDPRLDEVYAAAEAHDIAIMVHPLYPVGLERIGGSPALAALAAFPLETALAATSLLTRAVTERFPRLRVLLSHGGGALAWILPRLRQVKALGTSSRDLFARDPTEMAHGFFYDTLLYDDAALRFLADAVGTENLLVGSDYPFAIKQDRPAEFATRALGIAVETFTDNASRFLRHDFAEAELSMQ
jgi:aminocarboxymuconate-semialdehyde decarboxylase